MIEWDQITAQRIARLAPSLAVPRILKLAENDEVISLAGGLPDPRIFPIDRIQDCMDDVLVRDGAAAMNYGPNPGFSKLREWIAGRMASQHGVELDVDQVLVTSGGVEALNLVALSLLDAGDTIVVEAPTYMVSLHIARAYGVDVDSVGIDAEGAEPRELDAVLRRLNAEGRRPKYFYTVPTFQNPSGRLMSVERRREIVNVCAEHEVIIVEDHAYGELSFDSEPPPSLFALAPERVIFVHTFSKIFGPGVRLGWLAADKSLIERASLCKVGTDQCSNSLTQRLVLEYATRGFIDDQVAASRKLYRDKRDHMLSCMAQHLPSTVSWQQPGGGFFVWVDLPDGADSDRLLSQAIERHKTAFVSGTPFFSDGRGRENLRLSFSYVDESAISQGILRLGAALAG